MTEQYDRYVRGDTVLAMPQDAGLVRVDEQTSLGVALAVDGNGRYGRLDPYAGAQLALAEAYRNVAATGARPLAVTNCLNFGSPEDPAVMWQFTEAVRGLADACLALGVPVTGGNVSFYNQTGDAAIHPTPVVGVLGVHDDVRSAAVDRLRPGGLPTWCCSAGARRSSAGRCGPTSRTGTSAAARPPWTWTPNASSPPCWPRPAARGLLEAAHDLSDGGLAIALAECCLAGGQGCRVQLPGRRPGEEFTDLFGESTARAVVAVRPGAEAEFAALCPPRRGARRRARDDWRREPGGHRQLRHPAGRTGGRAPRHPACPVRLRGDQDAVGNATC